MPPLDLETHFLVFEPETFAAEATIVETLRLPRTSMPPALAKLGEWRVVRTRDEADLPASDVGQLTRLRGASTGVLVLQPTDVGPGWMAKTCANEPGLPFVRRQLFVSNGSTGKEFNSRGKTSAIRASQCVADNCGFGIFDSVFEVEDVANLKALGSPLPEVLSPGALLALLALDGDETRLNAEGGWHLSERQRAYSDLKVRERHIKALAAQPIHNLLAAKLGLDPKELILHSLRYDLGLRADSQCEMHSDFVSLSSYVFTAILYLNDYGEDFTGGETIFAHDVDGAGLDAESASVESQEEQKRGLAGLEASPERRLFPLTKGAVVQPKTGRVVLFSGGQENLHCKMASRPKKAARTVVQLWFSCADPDKQSIPLDSSYTQEKARLFAKKLRTAFPPRGPAAAEL